MTIINTISLESNKQIKINFNGGDLSSDGGLLLVKEFASKIGLIKLAKRLFKTNDHTECRIHKDPDNLIRVPFPPVEEQMRIVKRVSELLERITE